MSCQDQFARIVQKRGEGEPTVPASADHQNNDWLVTDLYQGEFYEDTVTGIVYYRNENGIEVVFDPSFPGGPTIYTGDGTIGGGGSAVLRIVTLDQTDIGRLVIDASDGNNSALPSGGDGLLSKADAGTGLSGSSNSGVGVQGTGNVGVQGDSTTGVAVNGVSSSGYAFTGSAPDANGSDFEGGTLARTNGYSESKHASAAAQVSSITQGFLPPRMTTVQRGNIVSPATGLKVYDTTTLSEWSYNGTNWIEQ